MKKRGLAAAAGTPQGKNAKITPQFESLFKKLESINKTLLENDAAAEFAASQTLRVSALSSAAPSTPGRTKPNPTRAKPSLPSPSVINPNIQLDAVELARRRERFARFQETQTIAIEETKTLVREREAGRAAVGSSQALEREYLRLTRLPSVQEVRPPHILAQALELVKRRWVENHDSAYASSQLKSIRQDLTVQHVENELAVQTYETHARIALESGDWAEFKQCHASLQRLWHHGAPEGVQESEDEFAAYGILLALLAGEKALLATELRSLTTQQKFHSMIDRPMTHHALQTALAFLRADWRAFFLLANRAPRMAPYCLDPLLEPARERALHAVLAAYNSDIPVASLADWWGFKGPKTGARWLRSKGAVIEGKSLQIKPSREGWKAMKARQHG